MSLLSGSGARSFSLDNWGYPPHNRASFQQVQQLFPTVRLARGNAPPATLNADLQAITELEYPGLDGGSCTVAQMLDDTWTDAFLVTKNGVIVFEDYRNTMGPESLHLLNSVSKSFLGMLVGILAHEGRIDPAEPLVSYLPEFADTAFSETTVQQALDMSGAVAYGEDYADRQADFWKETAVVGWRPALVNADTPATLFDYACTLRDTEQSDGEHFHYRTVFTNVVAMAVERATNTSVATLVEQKLWQPLGPEQDACVVADSSGFPYFGAGMNACARDLARFGQMLVQNGNYNGQQIVPAEWVRDTLEGSDELRRLFAESAYGNLIPGGHYRNQVWSDAPSSQLICIGIHGQTIFVDQTTAVVIVKLSTHPESAETALFTDTFAAMRMLCATV